MVCLLATILRARFTHVAIYVGLLAVCGAPAQAQPAQAQTSPAMPARLDASPPVGQIRSWIEQLNADQFDVRTNATDKLILAGIAAIGPVSQAVKQGNLEVTTRAIYILRQLALSDDVPVQEEGVEALRKLVESPHRSAARLAQQAMHALGQMRQQETVARLTRLGATIRGYRAPGVAMVNLMSVEIGEAWKGTSKDLQQLRWLHDLSKVTFVGPRVTDSWIASIRGMNSLRYIVVKHAQITDRAIQTISQLKSVVYVDLMYCPITDAGFQHLSRMKSVRKIRCFGTKVSMEGADRLQAELANAEVEYKRGAFLGVGCQFPPWPCAVTYVTQESGAQKAGVRVGDIIVRYDKQPVSSFDDLKRLIAHNKVGDTVEIQVVRNSKPVFGVLARRAPLGLKIEGEPTPIGIKITSVQADGPAARAGIRENDWIIALDEQRVASIDQLQQFYKKKTPNRAAQVRILRNVKLESFKVTFGEWNE